MAGGHFFLIRLLYLNQYILIITQPIVNTDCVNTPKGRIHDITYPEKDFLRQGLWKKEVSRIGQRSEK